MRKSESPLPCTTSGSRWMMHTGHRKRKNLGGRDATVTLRHHHRGPSTKRRRQNNRARSPNQGKGVVVDLVGTARMGPTKGETILHHPRVIPTRVTGVVPSRVPTGVIPTRVVPTRDLAATPSTNLGDTSQGLAAMHLARHNHRARGKLQSQRKSHLVRKPPQLLTRGRKIFSLSRRCWTTRTL